MLQQSLAERVAERATSVWVSGEGADPRAILIFARGVVEDVFEGVVMRNQKIRERLAGRHHGDPEKSSFEKRCVRAKWK